MPRRWCDGWTATGARASATQKFPVHWGGDVPVAWEMLAPQLHGGLSLGLSGFSFWSADIGGTGELPDDQELLIRWLQWAVLLSHPRVHGMGEREPCRWPDPARRVARGAMRPLAMADVTTKPCARPGTLYATASGIA